MNRTVSYATLTKDEAQRRIWTFYKAAKNNYGHLLSNYISFTSCRDVAQSGRALRSGRRSRAFKSRHPDHSNINHKYHR